MVIPASGNSFLASKKLALSCRLHLDYDVGLTSFHHIFGNFISGIIDIEAVVVVRTGNGEAAFSISVAVHRTGEKHHCGSFESIPLLVEDASGVVIVSADRNIIIAYLSLHHFDGIAGNGTCHRKGGKC